MLTLQEIRQLSEKALTEEITSAENDLLKIQFDIRNGSSKESHKIRQLKKYVARLKTLQKELKVESPIEKKEPTEEKSEKKKSPAVKTKKVRPATKKK